MKYVPFNWRRFHAYRVFDEFLDRFVLQRKSYVTRHNEYLDFEAAFEEIKARFVAAFDDSEKHFEEKVVRQFEGAAIQTKIVFANVEYLWAMPMQNISPKRKRAYAERWFPDTQLVVSGDEFYFVSPHIIADPGSWYLRNKYWEIIAALRVLYIITTTPGLSELKELKEKIAEVCHSAMYQGVSAKENFAVTKQCGIHSALMHLAAPERFESIISAAHRRQICAVFGHVVENPSRDVEILLKQIRNTLFDSHGNGEEADNKYRWFFYSRDILPLWLDKKSKKEQRLTSVVFDVRNEEDAAAFEGDKEEFTGYRIRRSAKLVKETKNRDGHTCRACNFHFEDQIVHVHHLDPIGEYKYPQKTKLEDLVTLCPTCHFLAHYLLRDSAKFKQIDPLLAELTRLSSSPKRNRTLS
ncbi:MAG: HNH endonuclease [Ignavibacteriae bacterium]|nr:HNH endonuclease [Ignavibacteriota bacterium]